MCIALPLGPSDNRNQSALWLFIRSTPLNMLLFSAVLQLTALFFISLFTPKYLFGFENYLLIFLFWIFPFISYALLMNFYPRLCQQGEIEYLQYAALNTLGFFNFIIFCIAAIYFKSFINIVLSLQLLLLIYAYKPIWKIGFWTGRNNALLVKLINFSSLLIALSLVMTLIGYAFKITHLFSYAPYFSLFQLPVMGLMLLQKFNLNRHLIR